MTREEAINHLSILFERISDTYESEIHIADIPLEAIDMAIKALGREPILDKILKDAMSKCDEALEIIDKLISIESENKE